MQLSEFRDLLANDGFAATFQTMGQYRTELLRALDKLSAQADARPVAIPTIEGAKLELHSDLHLKDLRLLGCHIITNGFKVHAHSQEAIESCVLVGAKPHTHPEASAPGLSDDDLRFVQRVLESDAPAADRQRARDLIVQARLTRASAATVAEASSGEEIHVNVHGDDVYTVPLLPTGMETPRFVVHVPAAEEAPNRRADELEAFKAYNPLGYKQMDGLLVWRAACAWQRAAQKQADLTQDERAAVKFYEANPSAALFDLKQRLHTDAQQQAEPGADERAAFEEDFSRNFKMVASLRRLEDGTYSHPMMQTCWEEWQAKALPAKLEQAKQEAATWKSKWEAAQSRQRAGMAEDGKA